MVAEGGESKASAAAELGLAQFAAVEGVENLSPLSGSAGAGHPEPSRRSGGAVDAPYRALTDEEGICQGCTKTNLISSAQGFGRYSTLTSRRRPSWVFRMVVTL